MSFNSLGFNDGFNFDDLTGMFLIDLKNNFHIISHKIYKTRGFFSREWDEVIMNLKKWDLLSL